MKSQLQIPHTIQVEVEQYLLAQLPEEACGFLSGAGQLVSAFHPIENELHSPIAYRMNPSQQIQTMIRIEEQNLEVLAIIHSHPSGPAQPSTVDLREASWDGMPYIIIALQNHIRPTWRGWLLTSEKYEEIPLFIKK